MPEDVFTIDSLSASLKRQVQALKRPVTDLSEKFGVVREKLKDTAPKVMALFTAIKVDHAGFSFVEFARLFAPDMPTNAADRNGVAGYRNHRVYQTLDYMRRLSNLRPRGQRGVRDSASDALARSIATILQVVSDAEPVWAAVQSEFNFGERVMSGLRKRVEATKPLFALTAPRPVKVGNLIHMEPMRARAEEGTDQIAGAQRAGRRRVRVAA